MKNKLYLDRFLTQDGFDRHIKSRPELNAEGSIKVQVKNSYLQTLSPGDILVSKAGHSHSYVYLVLEKRNPGQLFVSVLNLHSKTISKINIANGFIQSLKVVKIDETDK